MENYRIRKIDAHTWQLEDPFRTYLYLIEGTKRAVLIDAGNGFSGLKEMIASLTDKPVSVVLTHGHFEPYQAVPDFLKAVPFTERMFLFWKKDWTEKQGNIR